MSSFFSILSDPSTFVGGIIVGLISTAIYNGFGRLPSQVRAISRKRKLAKITKIRKFRSNPMYISYIIGNANNLFIMFNFVCFLYLAMLVFSSAFREIINLSIPLTILVSSPIFIIEIIWLFSDSYAKKLVDEHGKYIKYKQNA
nr:hypothetical protein [uncultured Tolumonas sp.]